MARAVIHAYPCADAVATRETHDAAECSGCRKATRLDLARPMGQRQAGERHRQAQVHLDGSQGQTRRPRRLNGTGSAIGGPAGIPGCMARWHAARLPSRARAAAGGPGRVAVGHR